MEWEVEFTDEFGEWWDSLNPDEQDRLGIPLIYSGDLVRLFRILIVPAS